MPFSIVESVHCRTNVIAPHGSLARSAVAKFEFIASQTALPLCVDATNLTDVSADGSRALIALERRGATVVGLSPPFEMLLHGTAADRSLVSR